MFLEKTLPFISTNPALQVCKVFFATILILCKIDPILVTFPVSNQPSKAIDQTASQPVDTTHTSVKTVYLLIMNIVENTLETCLPSTDFESQPLVSTLPNTYEGTLNGKFALRSFSKHISFTEVRISLHGSDTSLEDETET